MNLSKRIWGILLLLSLSFSLVACDNTNKVSPKEVAKTATTEQVADAPSQNLLKVSLYVAKADGSGLTRKTLEMKASEVTPTKVLAAAIEADRKQEHPLFTKDMEIEKVSLKDGVATVAVNDAFVTNKRGELTTQLQLGVIVNTITGLDGVKSVRFSKDGKLVKVIGSYDVSEPIQSMKDTI